jgi:hypothetical protein
MIGLRDKCIEDLGIGVLIAHAAKVGAFPIAAIWIT